MLRLLISMALCCVALPSIAQIGASSNSSQTNGPDSRVTRVLDQLGLKYDINADQDVKLTYDVGGGRTHLVTIYSNTYTFQGIEVREIRGFAARYDQEPRQDVLMKLLLDNADVKFGAWEVNKSNGKYYVVFSVRAGAEATASVLKGMMQMVYTQADTMEKDLTNGADEF